MLGKWLPTQPLLSSFNKSYGTTMLLSYDIDRPSSELCDDMVMKSGVLCCHGDCFDMPNTFRLGYGFGEPKKFQDGLEKMAEYLKQYQP